MRALRVERTRSLAVPAPQGVGAIFLFYTINEYGGTLATQGVTPAPGTPWAIVGVVLPVGALRIWRMRR